MVFVGHAFAVVFISETLPAAINHGAWLLTPSPWVGVWVFFVLSGYLMGKGFYLGRYSFTKKGAGAYFINRALKIVPLYWTAVLVCYALINPEIFQISNLWMLWNILFFNYDGTLPINPDGALWTVSTEVHFYLMVPFLFGIFSTIDRKRAFIFIGAALVASLAYRGIARMIWGPDAWVTLIFTPTLSNMDLFLTGFFLNPIIQSYKTTKTTIKNGIAIGFGILAIFYVIQSYVFAQGVVLHHFPVAVALKGLGPTITAIFIALVIAMFELGDRRGEYKLGRKTQIFGLLTYAIYVWHAPILTAIKDAVGPIHDIWSASAFTFVAFSITLIVGAVSYYLIEVPFERFKTTNRLEGKVKLAESSPL